MILTIKSIKKYLYYKEMNLNDDFNLEDILRGELKEEFNKKHIISFHKDYLSDLLNENVEKSTKAHVKNPWFTQNMNNNRMELFKCALNLTKSFIYNSSYLKENLSIIFDLLYSSNCDYKKDEKEMMFAHAFNSLQILIPVFLQLFHQLVECLNM
ncbi:hypothetical protein JN03_0285 [Metamycoplasma hyosynoviae]|uniref:Uncharacterized protein n=3 Tax=Metamycoplasma hyosynoviae TaxID=29559 RepID=A0A4R7TXU4_9BACT|nr:hypothetical protein JN03_0285 [Metamycoplasma hyosynoviae]